MEYVAIVVMLALLQFVHFSVEVGRARGRFNVPVPATSGNVRQRALRALLSCSAEHSRAATGVPAGCLCLWILCQRGFGNGFGFTLRVGTHALLSWLYEPGKEPHRRICPWTPSQCRHDLGHHLQFRDVAPILVVAGP